MMRRLDLISIAALAGAVLLWGSAFAAAKAALDVFSPACLMWLRMTIAALIFACFARKLPRPDYRPGDWMRLLAMALCLPCFYFLLESNALTLTTAGQAGMVSALVPLLVALAARFFLHETVTARTYLGCLLSFAGVAGLSLAAEGSATAPAPMLGNFLELLAMGFAAAYMLIARKLSTRYNPWLLTGMQAIAGAIFFLPGAFSLPDVETVMAAPMAVGGVLWLGMLVTLGAFGLYNVALTRMPASHASISINLVPVAAVGFGALLLGETFAPSQYLYSMLVLFGVFFSQMRPKQPVRAGA